MEINYEELDLKANPGAFSVYDAEILIPEIIKLKEGDIYLEVGVDRGKSLSIVRMVNDKCEVIGVDLEANPKVLRTRFHQGDSVEIARTFKGEISVLFIDGDHTYKGCKRDIDAWYPHMKKNGVMLFHDCDVTSPGVLQAVAEFISNPQREFKEFKFCKTDAKNTSMFLIRL